MKKLVRDLIPQIIEFSGRKSQHYIAAEAEYREMLKMKLLEEVNEFLESESAEELADILEVMEAIYTTFQFDQQDIQCLKAKKHLERGGFKNKIILES